MVNKWYNDNILFVWLWLCVCVIKLTDDAEIKRCIDEANSRIALGNI